MGVITLTLISVGLQPAAAAPVLGHRPSCAIAIALGTYMGGWAHHQDARHGPSPT
jgi:PiT family inorganic phosphate transporter